MTTRRRMRQRCKAARRMWRFFAKRKFFSRHWSSWNYIEGRNATAASSRAAQGADQRRGASARRRKSISRAKTDPRRAIDFERTSRSIRGPTERLVATTEVLGTTSNDCATTTMCSRACRTRRRVSRTSRQTGSPFRPVGLGDWPAHSRRLERFQSCDPYTAIPSTMTMGWRPRIGAHPSRQEWPNVFHASNDCPTRIQLQTYC